MRIAAHRGTRLHAPENSRRALLSAYTGGASVLELDLQLTCDGHLVLSHDGTTERLTGQPGNIADMALEELLALDFSETFRPPGAPAFHYFDPKVPGRKLAIETFPELLEVLPEDIELLIELKPDSVQAPARREQFVHRTLEALGNHRALTRAVLYSMDAETLRLVRARAPGLRVAAFDYGLAPALQLQLLMESGVDGLVTKLEHVLDEAAQVTDFGRQLQQLTRERRLRVGAVLYPRRSRGLFTRAEYEALQDQDFVWSLSTDSVQAVASFVRPGVPMIEETFTGARINRRVVALGYAKANPYARVYQEDGVHVVIAAYDGATESPPPQDALERRVQALEAGLVNAAREWPYYSGGGLGLVRGIRGDFAAEVDYTVERVGQATTLEMAVLNVDPGPHQAEPPKSFRDKDSFYDPHGAPPYVGVEHDEDDGYRINWNLGSEYDSNQYGAPVGDGARPLAGRLRLERRGPYFSAYYRNAIDAPDWVCVGSVRNDSLNPVVYLRCVGKRWRQEDERDPSRFHPILPNHFTFRNLSVTCFG